MRILLIRHGETTGNHQKRFQGKKDYQLTAHGIDQMKMLAWKLKAHTIDFLYTSTLSRAIDSAEIINKHHALEIIQLDELDEYCWGIIEGYDRAEIHRDYPDLGAKMEANFFNTSIPDEEGMKTFYSRLKKFEKQLYDIHRLSQKQEKTVVVVSHGRVIGGLTAILSGYDFFAAPWPFVFSNASLTEMTLWEQYNKFRLVTLNDTCHLSAGYKEQLSSSK